METQAVQRITFKVADTQPEAMQTKKTTIQEAVPNFLEYRRNGGQRVLQGSGLSDNVAIHYSHNGLVDALVSAYNQHHNIVLRPEDFWITVLTQFSNYLNENAEELRNKFVTHENTKELEVRGVVDDFSWFARQMTDKISENIRDPSVKDWVLPAFSTTTLNDTTVCAVTLMASMQKYFTYKFTLCCGIPNVTLLGTPEDYRKLAQRVDRLPEFEVAGKTTMRDWHALLAPIFAELVKASEGKADPAFWNRVCHYEGGGSGPSYLSGWVTAFCCFDDKGRWCGSKRKVDIWGQEKVSDWPFIDTDDIPAGLISVPVTVDDNGHEFKTIMIAGSFAIDHVDAQTVQPRLDWCIAEVDESKKEKEKGWEVDCMIYAFSMILIFCLRVICLAVYAGNYFIIFCKAHEEKTTHGRCYGGFYAKKGTFTPPLLSMTNDNSGDELLTLIVLEPE